MNKKQKSRYLTVTIFMLFSIVLFLNNMTQLLDKFRFGYNLNILTWIGLVGTVVYALVKVENGEM